jgi:hypothetical protein
LVRAATAGLALLSVVLSAAGVEGAAILVLVVAVPVAAAAGLLGVAEAVEHELSRLTCLPAAASLLLIVAAAATRTPVIALGCPILLGLERLRFSERPRFRAVENR